MRIDLRDRLRVDVPILQAGMAGGLAPAELAAAVSNAGALGTVGLVGPNRFAAELRRARDLAPRRPIAANLLLPFTRAAHVQACIAARVDAVVLFFGFSRRYVARLREAGVFVLHQVGTVDEARRAIADGADAIIVQGLEAGGHLLAREGTHSILRRVLTIADGRPVLAAGGVGTAEDVRAAREAGANGVVCGSRFLLTSECRAHEGYKRRVLGAGRTIETSLFGFGWPARHRVVPNAATERWCTHDRSGPRLVRALERATGVLGRVVPVDDRSITNAQRLALPFYTPAAALVGDDARLLDVTPLYAGECVRALHTVVGAAEAVRDLSAGWR